LKLQRKRPLATETFYWS